MTDKERLTNIIHNAQNKYLNLLKFESSILADYLLANGVILSPVDIGKTVYKVSRIGKIVSLNVVNYDCDVITSPYDLISFNSFGKTVFLTREEAEKALERSKG